jgi:hypothetical protein
MAQAVNAEIQHARTSAQQGGDSREVATGEKRIANSE